MPTSNSIDWQIESIRVTAFFNGQLNPGMLETWLEKVSENSPSQVNKTPSSFSGISRSTAGFSELTGMPIDLTSFYRRKIYRASRRLRQYPKLPHSSVGLLTAYQKLVSSL